MSFFFGWSDDEGRKGGGRRVVEKAGVVTAVAWAGDDVLVLPSPLPGCKYVKGRNKGMVLAWQKHKSACKTLNKKVK
jgi:hypothetical protein